jgi:hypothetical protein
VLKATFSVLFFRFQALHHLPPLPSISEARPLRGHVGRTSERGARTKRPARASSEARTCRTTCSSSSAWMEPERSVSPWHLRTVPLVGCAYRSSIQSSRRSGLLRGRVSPRSGRARRARTLHRVLAHRQLKRRELIQAVLSVSRAFLLCWHVHQYSRMIGTAQAYLSPASSPSGLRCLTRCRKDRAS